MTNGQLDPVDQVRGNGHDINEEKIRTALVLYASETGTSEDAARSLGRIFERLRFNVEVKSMDSIELVRHVLLSQFAISLLILPPSIT